MGKGNILDGFWDLQNDYKIIFYLWETIGLEVIGGLRKLEDLRNPFIISLRVQKMSGQHLFYGLCPWWTIDQR